MILEASRKRSFTRHVQRPGPLSGEGVDRCRIGEIDPRGPDGIATGSADLTSCGFGCGKGASGQGDLRPGVGQRAHGLPADPRRPAGDDDAFAGQVDAREHLGGGERRSDHCAATSR